jgi:hypothetical protein
MEMNIDSLNLFISLMTIAYQSDNPVKTLCDYNIQCPTFEFLKNKIFKTLRNEEDAIQNVNHPQHKSLSILNTLLKTANLNDTYLLSMFLYLSTNLIFICKNEKIFSYIKSNTPIQYLWFDIYGNSDQIRLIENTFIDTSKPIRVKLNDGPIFSFNLSDCVKMNTSRSTSCFHVNGYGLQLKKINDEVECIVILTKYKDHHHIYYNDMKRKLAWSCAYFICD